jgi:hypothetical protein
VKGVRLPSFARLGRWPLSAAIGIGLLTACSGSSSHSSDAGPDSGNGNGGDSGSPDSGSQGTCAASQMPTGSVGATVTGSDALSFTFNCTSAIGGTGQTTQSLAYFSVIDGGVVNATATLTFFFGFAGCPTPTPGSSFDLSQTTCLQVGGSLSEGLASISFTTVNLSPPFASGTYTVSAWSSASGGAVGGTFANAVIPTTSGGGSAGQISLSGSYSAVNR